MTTTNEPLFSVVTIARDNLAGLEVTAHSLIAQSCTNYEWIVVDGDSSDGTKEYLSSLPARWTSEPDRGIYDAMNKGLARATGQYVIFMNAGDAFADADILATIAKAIEAAAPDFIYGDALETGGFYKKARDARKIAFGMPTHHQAMLYRRAAIAELRYDTRYKIAADYDFTARFLNIAAKTHYMPCAICIFDTGGVSQISKKRGRREQFKIKQELKFCGYATAISVYALQAASAWLKDYFPKIYKSMRTV